MCGRGSVAIALISGLLIAGCVRPPPEPTATQPEPPPSAAREASRERPQDDAKAAVAVARRYAQAIAAGDLAAAKQLLHTPTDAHRKLADVVNRLFSAYHRLRVAAAKQIGESEARRLPMNDAGTFFTERMTARLDGDEGDVVWDDDFSPDGTERELEVVRVDGQWKLSLKSFTSGDAPETMSDVVHGIGEANKYTRELEQAVAEVESGKWKTFKEINDAI